MEKRWNSLCNSLGVSAERAASLWVLLSSKYSEPTRYYHTLTHIDALLQLAEEYARSLRNRNVVDLAIFFHDVIYDPTASDNEEKSALLFEEVMGSLLDVDIVQVVSAYIIETKKHDVSGSEDSDLKYFIDFDVAVLGANREEYTKYAADIRREYIHVEESVYCTARPKFMRAFLQNTEFIYATEVFRADREAQARANIAWECDLLESGSLGSIVSLEGSS